MTFKYCKIAVYARIMQMPKLRDGQEGSRDLTR